MASKLKIILIVFLSLNILVLDVFIFWFFNQKKLEKLDVVENQNCPKECNSLINEIVDEKIAAIPTTIPTSQPSPTIIAKISQPKATTSKTKVTQYIPIPGSGSTLENKWVDLSGTEFYISTDDYPNLIGAYFEANMKLLNGNGFAYLRLFDVTAGIEVWGSEISTSSQNFTSVSSGKLTIRNGTHLYRVQAKSLTADTTIFNSGRIKMILQN